LTIFDNFCSLSSHENPEFEDQESSPSKIDRPTVYNYPDKNEKEERKFVKSMYSFENRILEIPEAILE
jgi:hypothetical protein